jgi:hypothetical protein
MRSTFLRRISILLAAAAATAGCLKLPGYSGPDAASDTDTDTDGDTDTGLLGNGQDCGAPGECESGNCTNDVCCDPGGFCCNDDTPCSDHLACDLSVFECFTECGPGGTDNDAACADGWHCDANACFEDIVTGACDEESDCASGDCVNDWCCEQAGLCCGDDGDCPDLFDGCATDNTQTCVFSARSFPDTGLDGICFDVNGDQVACSAITSGMDYYGQDGHYPGPTRSFTDLTDGRITDVVTGLVWTKTATSQMSWTNAVSECDALALGSGSWRLPKRIELQALVDFSPAATGGVDAVFDVSGTGTQFWTSTELAGSESSTAWAVDLDDGTVTRLGKDSAQPRALCVEE